MDNTDFEKVLAVVREREAKFLDPAELHMTVFNPFRRRGVTVEDIAYALGWTTERVLKGGFPQADLPKTRKVVKEMVKQGVLGELARERTLHWGSRTKLTYATPDFEANANAALDAWNRAALEREAALYPNEVAAREAAYGKGGES